jgi:transcriptional regulator with XRE-family HTH domain
MNQPDLGRKIAELRKAKGLTQEELVEKCNLNVRTLQRIESGEVTPRSYTIKAIFTALDYAIYNSSESITNKFSKTGFKVSNWLEQFYRYFLDLFNLKTQTMKKITILSIMFSAIIFGLLAFIPETKAQKEDKTIKQTSENNVENNQTKNRELTFSDFTAYGSFKDNDNLICRDVTFKLSGVKVNLRLLMFNEKTRDFKSNFVNGTLYTNRVEVSITEDEINDKLVMYAADNVDKSKGKILLRGNAKLTSTRNEYIEADEIIITLN